MLFRPPRHPSPGTTIIRGHENGGFARWCSSAQSDKHGWWAVSSEKQGDGEVIEVGDDGCWWW
ncbi:hypothetical protein L195_g032066 [Trifolium pratense]|uniref:Uncharacterized protein n=1 Tax=Trifolium pratense TaxID=57577 RepID=A0A2K3LC59_TRIPR|nr:hypothetical protein L195_g032066 [Trifolium pratense]